MTYGNYLIMVNKHPMTELMFLWYKFIKNNLYLEVIQLENILIVIEELGSLLSKYKDEIKYKDYEIDSLKKKIEQIEQYIDFYSKE